MSTQKFNFMTREAIWLAHNKKCAYTREPLDISNFHIDHIIPEELANDPSQLANVKIALGLPPEFDIFGFENLLPAKPSINLQKGDILLDKSTTLFFIGIAKSRIQALRDNLLRISNRNIRGKAVTLLAQCLERGLLSQDDVSTILAEHGDKPNEIFDILVKMNFADGVQIERIAKEDIQELMTKPIRLGHNDSIPGVTLSHNSFGNTFTTSCAEYDNARVFGFYALSNFDIKMSAFFEHQCGLLKALTKASLPSTSYISNPRRGIIDLHLLPYSLFPEVTDEVIQNNPNETYAQKVSEGKIRIKSVTQNYLCVEEEEGMGQILMEVCRADFNNDGIEDILIYEYSYATHGTLGVGTTLVITRKDNNGLFEPYYL